MFIQVTQSLLEGFGVTCLLFLETLALSLPLGLVITFGSMSRFAPLRWLTRGFIWVIRGTPLMLQVMIVFYGPGLLSGGTVAGLPRFTAALTAFVINYAAYFSEIFRGGIESIPKGQWEAAQLLGMTRQEVFFHVVLMQVVRHITAPMGNEFITLVKDTAIARVISVIDIIRAAERYISMNGLIWPLFYTAVFYLIFNGLLTILFSQLERRLSYYKV